MADPTGRLADRVRRYQMRHPDATMEDIASRVSMKGGQEGDFSAISPRLFEAAALGVCQVLAPDHYVDGLEPWTHYIPLEADFSNIDEVFRAMSDDARCEEIVEASQNLLLTSGKFTYGAFVSQVEKMLGLVSNLANQSNATDSSEQFDFVVQGSDRNLRWVQDYVRRAYLCRKMNLAIESLKSGRLLALNPDDEKWRLTAESEPTSVIAWLDAFQSKDLIVESLAIPWRTATSFTGRATPSA